VKYSGCPQHRDQVLQTLIHQNKHKAHLFYLSILLRISISCKDLVGAVGALILPRRNMGAGKAAVPSRHGHPCQSMLTFRSVGVPLRGETVLSSFVCAPFLPRVVHYYIPRRWYLLMTGLIGHCRGEARKLGSPCNEKCKLHVVTKDEESPP